MTQQPSVVRQTIARLAATEPFHRLGDRWKHATASVAATCPDAANACATAAIAERYDTSLIVVTPNPDYAQRIADQIEPWVADDAQTQVLLFTESEGVPLERYEPDRNATQARLATLDGIANPPPGIERTIVVASIQAVGERTLIPDIMARATMTLATGDQIDLGRTVQAWSDAGYRLETVVDHPGSIARRGGILDVFPIGATEPTRIELFGDEIESMRTFDIETQRSQDHVRKLHIPPASEMLPRHVDPDLIKALTEELNLNHMDVTAELTEAIHEELALLATGDLVDNLTFYGGFLKHGTVFDYMPARTIAVTCRPAMVREAAEGLDRRLEQVRNMKVRRAELPRNWPVSQASWNDSLHGIESRGRRVELNPFEPAAIGATATHELPISPILLPRKHALDDEAGLASEESAPDRVNDILAGGSSSVIALTRHPTRLRELLMQAGIDAAYASDDSASSNGSPSANGTPGANHAASPVTIQPGASPEGFTLNFDDRTRVSIISDKELFGITKLRPHSRQRAIRKRTQLENLTPGTFVVHEDHGIARFLEVAPRPRDPREHLVLEFDRGDRIYLPTENIDRIQIYQGGGEAEPKLSRMGTQEWKSARARAKRAAELVAGDLIELYARRHVAPGIAAENDTPWQQNLEDSFEYVETKHQSDAIAAVKADMESPNPMDRVICGDVGFGKTEVAVRAAFKAVQSGKQVAVLVPTTLLCQQHYNTFRERLKPFPVTVASLSRFNSNDEQQKTVEGLANGNVDVVIGTHRLLQRDIRFKDLGLAVIDEEQKFGVRHKEHLKTLRAQVDVLTLSATPIPRTLYMSLAGIRDMSNIETPPEERRPVRTFVSERSDEIIREAILREIDRGGQVFFLHNRVKGIERIHRSLRKLVPEASYVVGHGQMGESELETVIGDFDRGDADVLICTTIVEAGIDMPNVNTLIVDDADRFGLAQLHHIRGRVGRSARQAFAYFLVQPHKSLTEKADARLNTIQAAADLGAGYQIAMRDLEIRGMGNVIGAEQHGHVAAVGLHMYTKLLGQAVERLKRMQAQLASRKAIANGIQDTANPGDNDADDNPLEEPIRVDVYLGLDDRIPREYIEDLAQRLAVYQRVSWARSFKELDAIKSDLRDRYGPVPRNFDYTVATARIRLLARAADVDAVRVSGDVAKITLAQPVGDAKPMLQRILGPSAKIGNTQIRLAIDQDDDPETWLDELEATLELIESFKARVMALLASRTAEPEAVSA